jgi:hypothetical protein
MNRIITFPNFAFPLFSQSAKRFFHTKSLLLMLGLWLGLMPDVSAQVSMSTASGSYTQDFNTLQSSGTGHTWMDNSTIANWYAQKTGTGSLYDANDGSVTTAGNFLFSFGVAGINPATDRTLESYGAAKEAKPKRLDESRDFS